MPSTAFWDYVHIGRTRVSNEDEDLTKSHLNLQEGLFQIASQTCNILVQVNNTNNINLGPNFHYGSEQQPSTSSNGKKTSFHDIEQRVVLLQPKKDTSPQRTRFSRLSDYKRRLSVSGKFPLKADKHAKFHFLRFSLIRNRPTIKKNLVSLSYICV